jgi:ABC-type multidrug transport system permease subunit
MSSSRTQDGICAMSSHRPTHHPLVELTLARIREFVREPEAVFWVIIFPIALAFALGIAFRTKGDEPVYAGVLAGPGSTELVAALGSTRGIHARVVDPADVNRALRDGQVQVIIQPGTPPTYRFDPSRPESRLARLAVDAELQRLAGRTDRFTATEQPLQVVGARYIDWLIPGLLGMNIMGTGMWGIGFGIVWTRTKNLLKRFAATPMSRSHYLLGLLLARMVFLGAEVAALLVFAWLVFSVSTQGSLLLLSLVTVVGALAFGGLGLLVASRARTVEAVSGWMNAVMLPMWVLSGVFFSSANFPPFAQPYIHALPLTALNDALRAVMLDGASVAGIARELLTLTAWTVGTFAIALRVFRWR